MKKNFRKFTVDFADKAIKCSKVAYERACKGQEPEYSELSALVEKHPTFDVKIKTASETATKNMYRNLTFDKMREYIKTQPNSEEALKEMEIVIDIAEAKKFVALSEPLFIPAGYVRPKLSVYAYLVLRGTVPPSKNLNLNVPDVFFLVPKM